MAILRIRRDTAANWTLNDPVIPDGQQCLDTTNNILVVGDGIALYSALTPLVGEIKLGFVDYNNAGVAQSALINTWTKLTNDIAGAYTNTTYLPDGITTLWNPATNQLDFSELSLGDMVDIRVDIDVTTSGSNQDVQLQLELGIGGSPYTLALAFISPKTAGTYSILKYSGIYMGDANTLNNPAEIQLKSDVAIASGITVKGWYCKITRR